MKAFDRVLMTFGVLFLLSVRADAHDPSMPHHEWFNKQEMNPAVQRRLVFPTSRAATMVTSSRPASGLVKIVQTNGNT